MTRIITITVDAAPALLWKKSLIYGFGQLLCEENASGPALIYIQSDQVGSPNLITDANGALINRTKNMPFGERLLDANPNAPKSLRRYTNHEEDSDSNAIYMQARMYLAAYGKFAQPDPAYDQTKLDPESWNLYGYVTNNPVTHTDPDGRMRAQVDPSERPPNFSNDGSQYFGPEASAGDLALDTSAFEMLIDLGLSPNNAAGYVETGIWNQNITVPLAQWELGLIFNKLGSLGLDAEKGRISGYDLNKPFRLWTQQELWEAIWLVAGKSPTLKYLLNTVWSRCDIRSMAIDDPHRAGQFDPYDNAFEPDGVYTGGVVAIDTRGFDISGGFTNEILGGFGFILGHELEHWRQGEAIHNREQLYILHSPTLSPMRAGYTTLMSLWANGLRRMKEEPRSMFWNLLEQDGDYYGYLVYNEWEAK